MIIHGVYGNSIKPKSGPILYQDYSHCAVIHGDRGCTEDMHRVPVSLLNPVCTGASDTRYKTVVNFF